MCQQWWHLVQRCRFAATHQERNVACTFDDHGRNYVGNKNSQRIRCKWKRQIVVCPFVNKELVDLSEGERAQCVRSHSHIEVNMLAVAL